MILKKRIKVLISKPGLDGHETGARLIARVLRDAGMEVIYTGGRQTAQMIVQSALQEDVDVIGLSILSGVHKEASADVLSLLKENGAKNVSLIIGGIIPHKDIPELMKMGVKGVFTPGADTREVVKHIEGLVAIKG